MKFDLILKNAKVFCRHPNDPTSAAPAIHKLEVGIQNGKIVALAENLSANSSARSFDGKGQTLLPGAIDTQVHFREPGFPNKEDIATGTLGAVFGGVTSIFEMPNTQPPTLTAIDHEDKLHRAKGRAWCDYAFYMGADATNYKRLPDLETRPGCPGIKIFLGSSTGHLVLEDSEALEFLFSKTKRRLVFHAESEPRLTARKSIAEASKNVSDHPVWRDETSATDAVSRLLKLSEKYNHPIHILHVSSAGEMELLRDFKKKNGPNSVTVEVTPQHLLLSAPEAYLRLGTFAQMNPPIRDSNHQKALWEALEDRTADIFGSDHAPHTKDEKAKPYPQSPSGLTGVQTLVPLLLDQVVKGRLSLNRFVEMASSEPARIFGIRDKGEIAIGKDADLILVNLNWERTIKNSWIQSRCGWSPFDGTTVKAWVEATLVRGNVVMRDDQLVGRPLGQPVLF